MKNRSDTSASSDIIAILHERFEKNFPRHRDLPWLSILQKLEKNPDKLNSLNEMERTGGEPDVLTYDASSNTYLFCDFSTESPIGRRSLCYDRAGLESRKEHQPSDSAVDMAAAMGVELMNEEQYRALQAFGEFDKKTSSWIHTPEAIRKLGGALFCDRRYGHVFVYHNGAQSYYSARGFRAILKL